MKKKTGFTELKNVFKKLHGHGGCLWDKQQTHKTLVPYLREESNEFIAALKNNDAQQMKEELGDIYYR